MIWTIHLVSHILEVARTDSKGGSYPQVNATLSPTQYLVSSFPCVVTAGYHLPNLILFVLIPFCHTSKKLRHKLSLNIQSKLKTKFK